MENTLKVTKAEQLVINKVMEGKDLTEKQTATLVNFLNEMEVKTEQQTEQTDQMTLEAWDTLNEDQQKLLKESLLKSKYGIGGEQFSTFPTLLTDSKTNVWVAEKYQTAKLPKRVTEQTFKTWEANGTLQILPLVKGERVHYLTIIKPNKDLQMDLWELDKTDIKPYQEYTTKNLLGQMTIGKSNFHILNSYTNKNKAYNQSKLLVKLFQLGTDFKQLEMEKDLKQNYLQLDITNGQYILKEIKYTDHKPNGKTFQSLGDYLGREQPKEVQFNYLENIN